jgi:hypothetical protein
MGYLPGALFREILNAVEDAQLNGSIATPRGPPTGEKPLAAQENSNFRSELNSKRQGREAQAAQQYVEESITTQAKSAP